MERKKYIDKLSNQLNEWDDKILMLERKTEKIKSGMKSEYQKHLNSLNNKKEDAKNKLLELNKSNEEAFEELKGGLMNSFKQLADSVEIAVKKYKNDTIQ